MLTPCCETDLTSALETMRTVARLARVGHFEYFPDRNEMVWSEELTRMRGLCETGAPRTFDDFLATIHPDDTDEVAAAAIDPSWHEDEREYRIVRPDGSIRHVVSRCFRDVDEGGRIVRLFGIDQDITDLKVTEERLRRLARTDDLTGMNNRRHFMERAVIEIERSRRYGRPLSFMILDVDHFKNINDTFGHGVGDVVLKALGARCMSFLRAPDTLGRLGGEEFGALLPETEAAAALELVDRLRQVLSETRVDVNGQIIQFTVSIGVSALKAGDGDVSDMLRRADDALYRAKSMGRNRVIAAAA
jgi:diguanylate cyclase (GGDEF)-like protein